jgi:hypothetical protein
MRMVVDNHPRAIRCFCDIGAAYMETGRCWTIETYSTALRQYRLHSGSSVANIEYVLAAPCLIRPHLSLPVNNVELALLPCSMKSLAATPDAASDGTSTSLPSRR